MRALVLNWLDRENPRSGGAERHLHEVFGRIARRGHEVTVLCSGWEGLSARTSLDGIEVHRVGGRYSFALRARRYARRHLSGPWDVVVEDLNKVPLFTPTWGLGPVVPLVHHLFGATAFSQAPLPLALATWLLERPIPRVYRGLPCIAVSESTRADLAHRGLRSADIEVIPNGLDTGTFRPGEPGSKYPDPSLLYLGRLERYKGVDLVLRALGRLRDQGVTVRLHVAGKGGDETRLRALTRELALEDQVTFHGFVSEADKVELLQRSWIHVLTSPKEGWGISNIEAAACGTPTVASDSPGLRDSVRDEETGFLVPHGDIEALADRLAALVRDRGLRDRFGSAAARFGARFDWEDSASRVERFLLRRVAHEEAHS